MIRYAHYFYFIILLSIVLTFEVLLLYFIMKIMTRVLLEGSTQIVSLRFWCYVWNYFTVTSRGVDKFTLKFLLLLLLLSIQRDYYEIRSSTRLPLIGWSFPQLVGRHPLSKTSNLRMRWLQSGFESNKSISDRTFNQKKKKVSLRKLPVHHAWQITNMLATHNSLLHP